MIRLYVVIPVGLQGLTESSLFVTSAMKAQSTLIVLHPDEESELEAKPEVREDWTCQECMPREGTNKLVEVAARKRKGHLFESSTNSESSKGSKLKSRSSCTGKSGENSAELSSRRLLVPAKKFTLKSVNRMFYSGQERSRGETLFPGHRLLVSNDNTHKDQTFQMERRKMRASKVNSLQKLVHPQACLNYPDFDGMAYLRNLASNNNTHKDSNFPNLERRKMRASKVNSSQKLLHP